MDLSNNLDEIVARVLAKIGNAELEDESCPLKPKLMVLTQKHGDECHRIYESGALSAKYQVDCALSADYEMDPAGYEAVVLFNLTNDALSAIAGGCGGSGFVRLAARSLLLGKKIYVPRQEVELYSYAETAPAAFYGMMKAKLDFLSSCGVVFCELDELENAICGDARPAAAETASRGAPDAPRGGEITLAKRVVTEKDVVRAVSEHAGTIRTGERAIVTDLAKEYARERGVVILRGQARLGG